jgi:hypothetical protein
VSRLERLPGGERVSRHMTPERAAFAGIFIVTMLGLLSIGATLPVLPRYVKGPLDGGDLEVGIVTGAFAVTGLACRPIAGRFADARGRRPARSRAPRADHRLVRALDLGRAQPGPGHRGADPAGVGLLRGLRLRAGGAASGRDHRLAHPGVLPATRGTPSQGPAHRPRVDQARPRVLVRDRRLRRD